MDDADIFIGDHCMIGSQRDHRHGRPTRFCRSSGSETYNTTCRFIGKNVWIGAGAILLPGVRVGDGTVIGARERGHKGPALRRCGGWEPLPGAA